MSTLTSVLPCDIIAPMVTALLPSHRPAHPRLLAAAVDEVTRRGGEATIEGDWSVQSLEVLDHHRPLSRWGGLYGDRLLTVVGCSGWRAWSKNYGGWATIRYLAGRDDSGQWAVRVPGTVTTVHAALKSLTPAAVARALSSGRHVARQGDVYAVETVPRCDGTGELPESHHWSSGDRTLRHPAHAPLACPEPVRFSIQTALLMGRAAGRGGGD